MSGSEELNAKPEQPDVDISSLSAVFARMQKLLERAIFAMNRQDVHEAEIVAREAAGLAVAKRFGSADLRPLRIFSNTIAVYTPLTRTMVFHGEARFDVALSEILKTRALTHDTLAVVADYARAPDADPELQQFFEPMLMVLEIYNDTLEAMIRGEVAALHGDLGTYLELLRTGADAVRTRVERIPASHVPLINQIMTFCCRGGDRMRSRYENLSKIAVKRYLEPVGDFVFIVHGHDEAKWRELRDLLEDRFQLEPIVLKEEAGGGATLIAKFEEYADQCRYAFVLLTPDDFVEKGKKTYFQARPNVLFELGWFCGHFGRDHVAIVKQADTELPSDLNGLVTIDFRENIKEAVIDIERELQHVGLVKQPKKRTRKTKPADQSLG